jgi:hypothetical protein
MNGCLAIAFLAIILGGAGCRASGTDATLEELSSELDQTEEELKQVANKSPKEGVELLDTVYVRYGKILKRITVLTKSPVTKAQKDKLMDFLTRTKAQQTQLQQATKEMRKRLGKLKQRKRLGKLKQNPKKRRQAEGDFKP